MSLDARRYTAADLIAQMVSVLQDLAVDGRWYDADGDCCYCGGNPGRGLKHDKACPILAARKLIDAAKPTTQVPRDESSPTKEA